MSILRLLASLLGRKDRPPDHRSMTAPRESYGHGHVSPDSPIQIGNVSTTVSVDSDVLGRYLNTGCDYLDQGHFDSAVGEFTKAIEIHPRSHSAFLNRGLAHMRNGDFDAAIRDLNKAIRLNRDSADGYSNLGLVYQEMGDYDRALEQFGIAIDRDRHHAVSLLNRGTAFLKKGQADQARADWIRVLKIDPCGAVGQAAQGNLSKLQRTQAGE